VWVVPAADDTLQKRNYCASRGLGYHVVTDQDIAGFPPALAVMSQAQRKKVVVTGCYDWFHSGHVRFFEEVSELGELYVVVGSDANLALLKGAGHPLFPQDERRYVVQSIRYVAQALISSGEGWMDAEPEIALIQPDLYAVNEDGDKPEKREFCRAHGLEYVVLKRTPKEGLPRRQSTDLRGF
jgi:cytidyltransferase-like protein